MIKLDIYAPLSYSTETLKEAVASLYPLEKSEISGVEILKRALIGRDGDIRYKMTLALKLSLEKERGLLKMKKRVSEYFPPEYRTPLCRLSSRPVIVGSGPAGLFAALALSEAGARPIVLERGLDVDARERKIKLFNTFGILDTECNVQFGEGGAGTYSDGKLKVGKMDGLKHKILSEFVLGGANGEIMYSQSAHLGTDCLPKIVKNIRKKIISLGGEFIFGARLTSLVITEGKITGAEYQKDGVTHSLDTQQVILAVGHSARDVFYMLSSLGVKMESKPFGIGLRIEHPREYINALVYGKGYPAGIETASYHLVTHLKNGRSVYSFCMCPGGTVVGASSNEGAVVTNGMSEYRRDRENSNSALLVSVSPDDFGRDALSGFSYQKELEERAFCLSGDYKAPAMRLDGFIKGDASVDFGSVKPSYERGVIRHDLNKILPDFLSASLKTAINEFDAWLPGFYLPDAAFTGVETRSTSPVRILRSESYEAPGFCGLYPAGEGAGYSGGIISSAYDGLRCALAIIEKNKRG